MIEQANRINPIETADEDSKKVFDWQKFKTAIMPYLFISPFYIAFLLFGALPIIYSLFISFQKWNGVGPMEFNGLKNYIFLFTDRLFWKSTVTTFVVLLTSGIPMHLIALVFAFLLNSAFVRFKSFFKGILFLPYVTSSVAIAMLFWYMSGKNGPINYIFEHLLNMQYSAEFFYGVFSRFAISMILIWKLTGWNIILYLAGLQAIPNSMIEAARVDGASWPQIFLHVTLPLLRPMIYFAVTMTIIAGMQLFDEPTVLLTNEGGYGHAGMTMVMYTYTQAFNWGYFGRASASSYVLFLIIFAISRVVKRYLGEKKEEK